MFTSQGEETFQCFLCREKSKKYANFKAVEHTILPMSRKLVNNALKHFFARCNKTELMLMSNEVICINCYNIMADYDCLIVKAMRRQQQLVALIEKGDVEDEFSGVENECLSHMETMPELNDDSFFDDVLDSENEIDQTVNEMFGVMHKRKRPSTNEEDELPVPKHRNHYFEPTLQCPLCAMRFRSRMRLQKHIRNIHKKFKCEICEYSHRNKDYVKLHMNTHEGRDETCCLYCFKQFSSKISTIRHMEAHIDEKKYQCDKCGLCFSQTTILNNHKMQHEAEEQPLECDICKQMFKTKRTYRHHMLTHRPDRPRFCCEFCNKTFTEKYTLKVHKRTHPEANLTESPANDQQLLSTPEVGSTVQVQSTAFIETLTKDEDGRFNCIICEHSFAAKEQMNRHMEKEHDVILKSLALSNYSNYEVLNNENKKACQICGQMFGTQLNLEYHLKVVHM